MIRFASVVAAAIVAAAPAYATGKPPAGYTQQEWATVQRLYAQQGVGVDVDNRTEVGIGVENRNQNTNRNQNANDNRALGFGVGTGGAARAGAAAKTGDNRNRVSNAIAIEGDEAAASSAIAPNVVVQGGYAECYWTFSLAAAAQSTSSGGSAGAGLFPTRLPTCMRFMLADRWAQGYGDNPESARLLREIEGSLP